jgi:hypothetical protein
MTLPELTPGAESTATQSLQNILLQRINCLSKRLLVGCDIAPAVAVALMAGSFTDIMNAFGFVNLRR